MMKDKVRRIFDWLKNTNTFPELVEKRIALANNKGYLVPVCKLHENDSFLIDKLRD